MVKAESGAMLYRVSVVCCEHLFIIHWLSGNYLKGTEITAGPFVYHTAHFAIKFLMR